MIADEGLAWVFTAWFAILAGASTIGAIRAQNAADRASYIAHVVMLAVMAIMPWHWFMAVPGVVWISMFAAAALGYAVLTLSRPSVVVGPGAGHHARRLVAWYHVAMMLGMVWMIVLMEQLQAAGLHALLPLGADAIGADAVGAGAHGHGVAAPFAPGSIDVPPLWHLPLWMIGVTYLFAAMFVVAAVWFLVQLRGAPRGTRRGEALPARAELVIGAAIAAGMAFSYFVMS
ncbi:MAG TPA: DUF5134 domain-containing protein [Microbacteriaceae bacterium]|nr:DUF5134 domain-containing protein [Microbacteriaceae bacterium]